MAKYACQDELNHDLSDPTDSVTIEAFDPKSAASDFAERYDQDGDYPFTGSKWGRVKVRNEQGSITWWKIHVEQVQEYSAIADTEEKE